MIDLISSLNTGSNPGLIDLGRNLMETLSQSLSASEKVPALSPATVKNQTVDPHDIARFINGNRFSFEV